MTRQPQPYVDATTLAILDETDPARAREVREALAAEGRRTKAVSVKVTATGHLAACNPAAPPGPRDAGYVLSVTDVPEETQYAAVMRALAPVWLHVIAGKYRIAWCDLHGRHIARTW